MEIRPTWKKDFTWKVGFRLVGPSCGFLATYVTARIVVEDKQLKRQPNISVC